ncbi:MAG TPA: IclR family transcriptional regulator [Bryobacteraceae bacterium]|nr:IclR family transcriptional regulator [Bryobacteraceae bacterium]
MENSCNLNSVQRAFAILEFLGDSHRRWNISELSRRLGIPKSTTHVLMTTLERLGYITREGGRRNYTAAVKFYGPAISPARRWTLPERALAPMEQLVKRTGVTANLAVLDEGQALYIQKVSSPESVVDTEVGKRANLHCTAVGKVLLAYGNTPVLNALLERTRLTRHTENTISSGRALRLELANVQHLGYAFDDQEEEIDTRCIAVPVYNSIGRFVAGLGLAGTVGQIHDGNMNTLLHCVREAARQISAKLTQPMPGPAISLRDQTE